MTLSASMIIGVVVLLLIVAFLIVGVIYFSKKGASSKTELTIEVLKLLKIHFKQESREKQ